LGGPDFFDKYVRQQAEIEGLLRDWKPPPKHESISKASLVDFEHVSEALHTKDYAIAATLAQTSDILSGAETGYPLEVASTTRNVTIDGAIMSCSMRCGGARFVPPEQDCFRLCIRPLDPLDTNPMYIGMIPAGADHTEVGFFKREEGIFFRVGGYPPGREAMDSQPLDRKEPNKPEFSVFGERMEASLPMPDPGCGISVHLFTSFPRKIITTEKVQCTECKELFDSMDQFADHAFDDEVVRTHSDDFGFHSCRRVDLVEEGEVDYDPSSGTQCIRFQVESDGPGSRKVVSSAEPPLKEGVPKLPREMPELVGGKPVFGPPGPWQPCILLCTPGSRVEVKWLSADPPIIPPKEPEIRLKAKAKSKGIR
jgi:hypothetical protein